MRNMFKIHFGLPVSIVLLVGLFAVSGVVLAKAGKLTSFAGVWSGGGTVGFTGSRQRIDCRVKNTNKAGNEFYSTFSCAMKAFGKGRLTILMEKVGKKRYVGSFYDSYNQVNVKVSVLQNGRRQKVDLRSRKWRGVLHLRK